MLGQHLGSEAELGRLLGPLRRAGASLTTGTSAYGPLQVRWANGRTDPAHAFSAKSHYVPHGLPGTHARALLAEFARRPRRPRQREPPARRLRRRLNRPRAGDTAFVHRDARYSIQYLAYHSDGGAASRAWLRRMHRIVAPHASGAYQNYLDPELRGWRRAYYGRNLERLEAGASATTRTAASASRARSNLAQGLPPVARSQLPRPSRAEGPAVRLPAAPLRRRGCDRLAGLALRRDPHDVPGEAHFSSAQITPAEMSSSHGFIPCRNEVGNAWWLLCHDSPNDSGESHSRLRDSSPVSKRRRPKKWHSELIEYVTWWSRNTRTRPPHSIAVSPVMTEPPISTPSGNGIASPSVTHQTKVRSTKLTVGSAIRSGA